MWTGMQVYIQAGESLHTCMGAQVAGYGYVGVQVCGYTVSWKGGVGQFPLGTI